MTSEDINEAVLGQLKEDTGKASALVDGLHSFVNNNLGANCLAKTFLESTSFSCLLVLFDLMTPVTCTRLTCVAHV